MIPVALLFPGQGAQKVGMGKEFYEQSEQAKSLIDRADEVMGNGLKQVMFEGPAEKLTSTAYCQPGIYTISLAALEALRAHPVYKELEVRFTAGLSLGEYPALVAAGAVSFDNGLRLVERRSFFMEEATKKEKGAMAAVLGFDKDTLLVICEKTGARVANFNSPEQVVITGHADKVKAACDQIRAKEGKVIVLEVGGAFHSPLMATAEEQFARVLRDIPIQQACVPVIANVNGRPETAPEEIRANLARQITSPVQWVASVEYMASQGVATFLEIGPGTVLKGLLRKINRELKVHNIQKPEDLDKLAF